MIINEEKQEIALSFGELKDLVDKGLVSDKFLLDIEFQIGHHIQSNSVSNLKVVKTDEGNFSKEESRKELFARSIRETDEIIANNEIYDKLYFVNSIINNSNLWCNKDLFEYFELDSSKATEELQASMYPVVACFDEVMRGNGKEVWRTPYIIFLDKTDSEGNILLPPSQTGKIMTHMYYMNNHKNVVYSLGEVIELYKDGSFSNEKEWKEFAFKRKKDLSERHKCPLISHTFQNIKTGEMVYVIDKQLMGESVVAQAKNRINNRAWFQTWKGKESNLQHLNDVEKQLVIEKGRDALDIMHKQLLDIEDLQKTPYGYYSK